MASLYEQFGHPRGVLGALVGHLMALKNQKRSRWVLETLALKSGEAVLEIGFGSGADVRRAADAVGPSGRVVGVDVSEVMVRQASRRNRAAIKAGYVTLQNGEALALAFDDNSFDAAFSVNSAQFWPDLERGFAELFRVVRENGRAVIAVQPMKRGATLEDSKRWVQKLSDAARRTSWHIEATALGPTRPPVATVTIRKIVSL